jgi:peptide/nickel transport system substrate-binding protein
VIVVVMALGLAACNQSTASPDSSGAPSPASGETAPASSAATSRTLTAGYVEGPATIDPAQACGEGSYRIIAQVYDTLVNQAVVDGIADPTKIEPGLAESWDISPDGRTYTFNLRDATFASGNPVTADDVVFSLQRLLDAGGCASYFWTGGLYENIVSIKALDPKTAVVELAEPDPLFLLDTTYEIGIIDRKTLEANGGLTEEGAAWLGANAAGSGPYAIESYDPSREIVLTARKDYWGGAPLNDKVVVRFASDATTLETLLLSGDMDFTGSLPLQDLQRLEDSGLLVASGPSTQFHVLGFNTESPPLADVRVRQALAYASPIDQIRDQFGYGYVQPWVGPILPIQRFYKEHANPYSYDIEKAKALLAEAGHENLSLTVTVEAETAVLTEIATVLQSAWREAGADLNIKPLPAAAWFDEVNAHQHQAYIAEDGFSVLDPAFSLGYYVRCGDPFNWTQYCDQEVDAALQTARHSSDDAQRQELYDEVVDQVIEDAPYLQFYQIDDIAVAQPGTTGLIADIAPRYETVTTPAR